MSNKTQLQTNNNALSALITRVNAAKDVAASLPEAGSSESGGTTIETCSVNYDDGGAWGVVFYATLSGNDIVINMVTAQDGQSSFSLTNVVKNSTLWIGVIDASDYDCTNAELLSTTEGYASVVYLEFKITGNATIFG